MKNSIFAKASASLEARRVKVQNKLETIGNLINKLDANIATANGVDKAKMMARRSELQSQFGKEAKKYTALESSLYATNFLDDLFASFKSKWIPIIALLLLLMGPLTSLTSFIVGTIVNAVIVFALLCVVMHYLKKKYEENPETKEKAKDMIIAKTVFLAITIIKLILSFFGPTVMMVIVIMAAIAIALYIERNDLKILFERLKDKKSDKEDDNNTDNE